MTSFRQVSLMGSYIRPEKMVEQGGLLDVFGAFFWDAHECQQRQEHGDECHHCDDEVVHDSKFAWDFGDQEEAEFVSEAVERGCIVIVSPHRGPFSDRLSLCAGFADSIGGVLGSATSGMDGVHTANIALLGQYAASSFVTASDGHGGTLITDPPALAAQTHLTSLFCT
jgi:hypothetical protein